MNDRTDNREGGLFRYGIDIDPERQHPYRPMPDPKTGYLVIDPEIFLKAKGVDLVMDFFYSSITDELTRYGIGRSASPRAFVDVKGPSYVGELIVTRGDLTSYLWRSWQNTITDGLRTTFDIDVSTGETVETFPDGMELHYKYKAFDEPFGTWTRYYLSEVIDPSTIIHSFTYDSSGAIAPEDPTRLKTIEVHGGKKVTFGYTAGSHTYGTGFKVSLVSYIEDFASRRWTFQYDNNDYLTTLISALGCTTKFVYGFAGSPATVVHAIEDPRGYVTTYFYDSYRRVVSMVAGSAVWTWVHSAGQSVMEIPSGARTTYIYDVDGNLTTQIYPEGFTSTMAYDNRVKIRETRPSGTVYNAKLNSKWLTSVSYDPLGNATSYVYDSSFNLVSMLYADGGTQHFSYLPDATERLLRKSIDPLGRTTTFGYLSGLLRTVTDPRGLTTTYIYDGFGNRIRTEASDGTIVTNVYDVLGRTIEQLDQLGRSSYFAYDAGDHVISVTNAEGEMTRYIYDGCLLQAVVDPMGFRTTNTYGRFEKLATTMDPLGRVTSFEYDNTGFLRAVIDPQGNRATTVYNPAKQKIAEIDQLGFATSFVYDNSARLSAVQDARGNRTTNVYNARDLIAVKDALSFATSFHYDSKGRRIGTETPLGNRTSSVYDLANQQTAQEDALGYKTSFTYDEAGNNTVVRDALNQLTTHVYETLSNRLKAVVDANGARSTNVYDLTGQQIAFVDARGYITSTGYDAVGRPITIQDARGFITTLEYDADGRQVRTEDPLGRLSEVIYDAAGQVIANITPLGNRWTNVYDNTGRTIASEDPLGNRATNIYDRKSQLIVSQNPLGYSTSFAYDGVGNQIQAQDARGYRTSAVYDAKNRVLAQVDQLSFRITNTYDADDNLIEILDPRNGRTTMAYSKRAEMQRLVNQLSLCTTYLYDALARVESRQFPRGDVTTYHYDPTGRQSEQIYMDGSSVAWVYDLVGNRVVMIDPIGATTYTHDEIGNLVSKFDDEDLGLIYAYDGASQRTKLTDPDGGVRTFVYDSDGRTTLFQDPTGARMTFQYDPVGRKTTVMRSSETDQYWLYDEASQIKSIRDLNVGSPQDNQAFTYTYDPAGNRVVILDSEGWHLTYVYDEKGRLLNELKSGGQPHRYTYAYDPCDNRLCSGEHVSGQVVSYGYDPANRVITEVQSAGITTFAYDLNGNMILVSTPSSLPTTMVYDFENRLHVRRVANVNTYLYDGDGLKRVEITSIPTRETIVWDGSDYLQWRVD
ncbi:MAG: RHS repeat protein [Chlorobia bacterium]|nr:RHS repeat protein [Fimbriimonadaceae bacterium]